MIRLSDVKVQLQYRWRARQRLMVLHFARLQGAAAAGAVLGLAPGRFGAGESSGAKGGFRASCRGIPAAEAAASRPG